MAIATAAWPGGRIVAVSASTDGYLRLWDLTACPDLCPRLSQTIVHHGVRSVITALRAGRPACCGQCGTRPRPEDLGPPGRQAARSCRP